MHFWVSILKSSLVYHYSNEFASFVGAMITMGYNEQPEMTCYWSKSPDLGCPSIKAAFTRERFNFIWANLTYSCQTSYTRLGERFTWAKDAQKAYEKNEDPVGRVRMLADLVNRRFRAVRNPTSNLCVDETMIAYKGRADTLQVQPDKPIKKGFENYTLCDQGTGYVLNDEPHVGKRIQLVFADGEPTPQ